MTDLANILVRRTAKRAEISFPVLSKWKRQVSVVSRFHKQQQYKVTQL